MSGRVCFLLGAGASVEAEVCTTEDITDILVSYGRYAGTEDAAAIENLLRYIQVKIAQHLGVRGSEVNFEYILGVLAELESRKVTPMVSLLGDVDSLVEKIAHTTSLEEVNRKLYLLLRESMVVRGSVEYLFPLREFFEFAQPLDVFTLNYDISVETAFKAMNVQYTAGFRKRGTALPVWAPILFRDPSLNARLFKLHGSVNWGRYFTVDMPPLRDRASCDPTAMERFVENYPEIVAFDPFPLGTVSPPKSSKGMESLMNFGTRKEEFYAQPQFNFLFSHFRQALDECSVLVAAGYSFRDPAVNRIIEDSMASRRGGLHLVVVDPGHSWLKNSFCVELRRREWLTSCEVSLGSWLKDGNSTKLIREAAKSAQVVAMPEWTKVEKKPAALPVQKAPLRIPEGAAKGKDDGPSWQYPHDDKEIAEVWSQIGDDCGVCEFWLVFLHLRGRLPSRDVPIELEAAKELGRALVPLVRKVRDLVHHVERLYHELQLDPYDPLKFKDILLVPEYQGKKHNAADAMKYLAQLTGGVAHLNGAFLTHTEEFVRGLGDPKYGESAGGRYNTLGLVAKDVRDDAFSVAETLNDLYCSAGYQIPFNIFKKEAGAESGS